MNLLDWVLVVARAALRALRLLAGLRHRRRSRPPGCSSAGCSASGWRRSRSATRPRRCWCRSAALFIVIVCASLGQALFQYGGARLRDTHHSGSRSAPLDAVGGAVLSGAAVLLVAWALGVASPDRGSTASPPWCATRWSSRRSTASCRDRRRGLLRPSTTSSARRSSRATSSRSRRSGSSPSARGRAAPARRPRRAARRGESSCKIRGANSCGRGIEGSGFVYAPDRVMTNAHVVAGVDEPEVDVDGTAVAGHRRLLQPRGRRRRARRRRPGEAPPLRLRPRRRAAAGRRRSSASREDGPYDVQPARVARRAAAALARHLRRRRRHPRRALAARPDPAGQLRRPGRVLGRRRASAWCSPRRSPTTTPATP